MSANDPKQTSGCRALVPTAGKKATGGLTV
jgi:hypothetical protein